MGRCLAVAALAAWPTMATSDRLSLATRGPFRLEKLEFQVDSEIVMVERSDRQPIFESAEIEKDRLKSNLEPRGLLFRQSAGTWHSTLATLVF
jgi:hypothetical protein